MNSSGLRFSTRSLFVSVAAFGVLGGLTGCPVLNKEHCAYEGPDATVCGAGLMCSKCEISSNGCVAPDDVLTDCLFVASAGTTAGPDTTTSEPTGVTTTPDSTSSESTLPTNTDATTVEVSDSSSTSPDDTTATTDPSTSSTTVPDICTGNDQCEEDKPYCNMEGACIPCSEGNCAELDPSKPVCNGTLCVECINNNDCSDGKPYCNPMTATCEPCTIHEECPDTACNLETGECFPTDNVVYVQNTNDAVNEMVVCSDEPTNDGMDPKTPFCRLSAALAQAVANDPLTIKVKLGKQSQSQANIVPPDVTVAIVRREGTPVSLAKTGTDPALTVSEGSHVFIDQISMFNPVANTSSQLILCDGGSLWLERLTVYGGKVGMLARQCLVHVRRSTFFQNGNGGIDITETGADTMAKLWLENSYVTDNGTVFGVRASNNSYLDILYSTIAGNTKDVQVAAVTCTQVPLSNLRMRNSLIASGNGMYTTCKFADAAEDATNLNTPQKTLQDLVTAGIAASQSAGVVKAKVGGPLMNKAVWLTNDSRHSFDKLNVRPEPGPTADYAGADVP